MHQQSTKVLLGKAAVHPMIWNDAFLSDSQCYNLNHHYRDAQNKHVWREKTRPAHT